MQIFTAILQMTPFPLDSSYNVQLTCHGVDSFQVCKITVKITHFKVQNLNNISEIVPWSLSVFIHFLQQLAVYLNINKSSYLEFFTFSVDKLN